MHDHLGRLDAPAFHRNHEPIWSVLGPFLADKRGTVLELGSGTGQHVVEFARRTPAITWQPSDVADANLRSIAAWRQSSGLPNVQPPITIDLLAPDWVSGLEGVEAGTLVAVLCVNVVHISPWRVSEHLMAGVPRLLGPDGRLFLYGPYKRDGAHTAPSNAAFDANLRAQNPEWGIRDMDDLGALAERSGLRLAEIAPMPANNFVLVFTPSA
jgi:SAM-dependent methyltransferase